MADSPGHELALPDRPRLELDGATGRNPKGTKVYHGNCDHLKYERLPYQRDVDHLVQLMMDHEYYASDYSAKSQPHAANLLRTLHDSLVQYRRTFV